MRCYDGCPDSDLKALLDDREKVRAAIVKAGYSVTWFPNGEFYMAFKDYGSVTSELPSLRAVAAALSIGC